MSCSENQKYTGCGDHQWICGVSGYDTMEEACLNPSCKDCTINDTSIFGGCPTDITPLQTCVRNGSETVVEVTTTTKSYGLLGWLLAIPGLINAVAAFILFFYVLYFAVENADKGRGFVQFLYAFFLHPVYILQYLRKQNTPNIV
jgi:hypothetical protein